MIDHYFHAPWAFRLHQDAVQHFCRPSNFPRGYRLFFMTFHMSVHIKTIFSLVLQQKTSTMTLRKVKEQLMDNNF